MHRSHPNLEIVFVTGRRFAAFKALPNVDLWPTVGSIFSCSLRVDDCPPGRFRSATTGGTRLFCAFFSFSSFGLGLGLGLFFSWQFGLFGFKLIGGRGAGFKQPQLLAAGLDLIF